MVNALGQTLDEIWPGLIAGDQTRFTLREDLVPGVGRPFGMVQGELPEIPSDLARHDCRNNQLALAALAEIRAGIRSAVSRFGAERVAVVVGSSTAGIASAERALRERSGTGRFPAAFDLVQLEFGGLAEFLALAAGTAGPCHALSTACSAGAKALVSARTLLELDVCDAVIAGAVDSLCRLTANGFDALQAVADGLTNPMSRNRSGLTIGEGAALFLVTREPGGIQLLGAGASSDAHHMSAPDPEGRGAEACMRAALHDAGIGAADIAYLNLHGTGTAQNDAMESAAALGASGAIEIGFCWLMLSRREGGRLALPPHRWDGEEDSALAPLALVAEGTHVDCDGPAALMSSSFGFGGSNCAVIVGEPRC
jgi:3-oxoacyl-[acyl-carrier-protein] synthase-1